MKRNIYILPLLTAFALPASAQLDNTVEVTNEVKPVVKDANKINILPSVVETPVKHNDVQYQTTAKPFTKFEHETVRNYECDAAYKGNKHGYAHIGGGSHGQVDANAAYKFDISDMDILNVDVAVKGFNGKIHDNDKNDIYEAKSRFYSNRVAGRFDHFLDNDVNVFLKADFENQVFNYLTPSFSVHGDTDKQHNKMSEFAGGIMPIELGDFVISGEVGLRFFKQKYKTSLDDEYSENILTAKGDVEYLFSNEHSADLGIELFKSGYNMDEFNGITTVEFTPHYIYNGERLHLQLGAAICSEGSISPDVKLIYHVTPRSDFYVNAIGYDRFNEFRNLTKLHPYFILKKERSSDESIDINSEYHKVDASIGYRFSTNKGINADINLGYDISEDCAVLDGFGLYSMYAPTIQFADAKRFYANVDVSYAYKDIVKVDLKNQFNTFKYKDSRYDGWVSGSYTIPTLDLRWSVDVRLAEGLYAGLNWKIGCYDNPEDETSSEASYERPTTSNLGLSARYNVPVDIPLTVFVKGDNLLNQKYDRYFGYRTIGTNILAGIAVTF